MGVTTIDLGEIGSKVEPLDLMPVGYVYMSFDSTSPAELFGGTWVQIVNKVIRASTNTQDGGSDTVTLTTWNLPSHSHQQYGSLAARDVGAGGDQAYVTAGNTSNMIVSTGNAGSGGSFGIVPAYQNVFAWRREA